MTGKMKYVNQYFAMLGRETAIPRWMGGREHLVNSESPAPSVAGFDKETKTIRETVVSDNAVDEYLASSDDGSSDRRQVDKWHAESGSSRYWGILATGAGLFSDGYINNSIGFVTTLLKEIYPVAYGESHAMQNVSAIAFVGNVVGMLGFGLLSDYVGRKAGLLSCTFILIIFSILAAGSWGIGMPTRPEGMFAALTVYRCIIGIGIGGEYPSGSVAAAETSQSLSAGSRNRWFIWFTNFMIDFGYVVASFVAWLLLYICSVPGTGSTHGMQAAWRVLLGLGAIAPLSLLYLRIKFKENKQFTENAMRKARQPYWLMIKRYGPRLVLVSLIWFVYDFVGYAFGTYSSLILTSLVPDGSIRKSFAWQILFNAFYIPGSFLGALSSDYFGARLTLFGGMLIQGIVGFIMASQYEHLSRHMAPFVVAFGIFMTLGEFGPGDNIGLVCSKTSASAVRGRYYGIAAAIGKVGAFVGTYVFPAIAGHYGGMDTYTGQEVLFYVSAAICTFAAFLVLFIPELSQESIAQEDIAFRRLLEDSGYDMSNVGTSN